LLKAATREEERAFAELVNLFADTIYSQCLVSVKSVEKAEELTQDAANSNCLNSLLTDFQSVLIIAKGGLFICLIGLI